MPQSGGVFHSLPGGAAFGAVVGKARPHVVQEKVGVGPDQLEALLGLVCQAVGDEFGRWQDWQPVV